MKGGEPVINEVDVYCPYYRRDKGNRIMCEPLISGAESQVSHFHNVQAKEDYMLKVCCSRECYRRCMAAEALARFYRGEEEDP